MSTLDETTLGQRLRATRHARGLTLTQLAARAGLRHSTLCLLELGQSRVPRVATLIALAYVLEVDPAWLIDGDSATPTCVSPTHTPC